MWSRKRVPDFPKTESGEFKPHADPELVWKSDHPRAIPALTLFVLT